MVATYSFIQDMYILVRTPVLLFSFRAKAVYSGQPVLFRTGALYSGHGGFIQDVVKSWTHEYTRARAQIHAHAHARTTHTRSAHARTQARAIPKSASGRLK